MTAEADARIAWSVRQRAAVFIGSSPFLGGIGIATYIIGARQQPTGALHAFFLALICAPAAWLIVRHHVRSRDGFLASTTLTTFGTVMTLVVAYLCALAGSAVTVWFSEMITSTDVRVGSLAVTSALSMIAAVVGFVWRCLK